MVGRSRRHTDRRHRSYRVRLPNERSLMGPVELAARLSLEMQTIENELKTIVGKRDQELINAYAFAYGRLKAVVFIAAIDIRLLDPAAGLTPTWWHVPIDRKA